MKKLIALIMVLALSVACFAGCQYLPFLENLIPQPTQGDTVTVCWYQGSKLLKEEQVAKGTKLTAWTPEAVEGKDFTGWFAEASLTVPFDFETVIEQIAYV